jgi:hypothetical protein
LPASGLFKNSSSFSCVQNEVAGVQVRGADAHDQQAIIMTEID